MIVRMKEILLFTSAKSVDDTVQSLGELGVLDVKEINKPNSYNINRIKTEIEDTETAILKLEPFISKRSKASKEVTYNVRDPKQMVERFLKTKTIENECYRRLEVLNQQLDWYHTWGEKTVIQDFKKLAEKSIYLRLYVVDKKIVPQLQKEHYISTFAEKDGKVPIAFFTRDESVTLQFKEVLLPNASFESVTEQISRKERQLESIAVFLEDQAQNIAVLEDYKAVLMDRLAVEETTLGMGDIEGKCNYLKGYIPKTEVASFKEAAKAYNWGYSISDPEKPEDVPVYIKNPKWISIINPVMKFIDIVPGYKEVDVSIYFLIAFALFFAMLVGDAGYGLIFLLLVLIFRKKLPTQARVLVMVLSISTIIWGVLSGTYFGSSEIAELPFLKMLIVDNIASFGVDNVSFMMHLSFLIGAIHLTIAHSVRAVQFINSIRALSQLGWIALVWGLFFVTEQLVLGIDMPEWGLWLFVAGGLLVALFSVESKNFFKSILISIANLPLSLISGFSDIVSYVRLFAVGMATAAVAASFNNMILSSGIENMGMLEILFAAIALLLGHGLNIALALMAVMVHGIRLNMLEFASHLGVDFSGEAYKPFKLITSDNNYNTKNTEILKTI
ncbi:V-type ATP synthase subunit I [Winogradskyella helgolandensis]|uniref:V-type ATP synthase subunit I n=1 Tax=Winogradskyella helgolandensis TaxID=2697010 RepID=UPI0015CC7777|nr:hypothetical protein [Winogradskyella helgolandensis]